MRQIDANRQERESQSAEHYKKPRVNRLRIRIIGCSAARGDVSMTFVHPEIVLCVSTPQQEHKAGIKRLRYAILPTFLFPRFSRGMGHGRMK